MRKNNNFKQLERAALWKRVGEMEEVPLMLVFAPAGFGKSTVVREYIRQNTENYLWISLGPEKVSEEWLWNRINQGLKPAYENLSRRLTEMGLPTEESMARDEVIFLDALREELEGADFYMVLDDYQTCNGPVLNRLLTRMAYEDIPGVHVIIISRIHIDMPLEEMQLKGYCSVINQADLTLTREETKQLFAVNGISLDEEQLCQVYEYTDGWIAAASLLQLDYRKSGVLQSTGTISRLLREVVYSRLSEEDKSLLYRMSYYVELSLKELEVVTGQPVNGKRMEELMERTGLVHYNAGNQKYTMHSLLRAVAQESPMGEIADSYRKYAAYLEWTGNYIVAVGYYWQAGDRKEIFRILDGPARMEVMETLPDFVHAFFLATKDKEELLCHPMAVLSYIHFLIMSADEKLSQEGKRFYRYISSCYEQPETEGGELQGELMIIDSLVKFNNIEAANRSLCKAWELRKHKPSVIFARKIYSYGVPETLFLYHREPGRLREIATGEIEYSQNYMRLIYNLPTSLEALIEAEYALETGQVKLARQLVEEALEKAEFHNQPCAVISSYLVILRCLVYQGDRKSFHVNMEKLTGYMENTRGFLLLNDYEQVCGYVYAITGQLDKIPMWLRNRRLENCNQIVRDCRSGCIIYGIFLCRKKQWRRLAANAEEMAASFANTRHVFAEIYAGIFYSMAIWNLGEKSKALEHFRKVLGLAERDSVKMPFVEMAAELLPLLRAVEKEPYAAGLIHMCEQWLEGVGAFRDGEHIDAMLTPREHELMELLSIGCRNSDIGRKMNIAQVTVEKNLTNIYRKIGVRNRIGAIRWYTEVYKPLRE